MATLDQAIIRAFGRRRPEGAPGPSAPPRPSADRGRWLDAAVPSGSIDVAPGHAAAVDTTAITAPLPDVEVFKALASCVGVVLAGASIPPLPAPRIARRADAPTVSQGKTSADGAAGAKERATPAAAMGPPASQATAECQVLPLSLHAQAIKGAGKPRPLLEVDQFRWPEICIRLLRGASVGFAQQCANLLERARQGSRIVAVTGGKPREGRTTMLLCLAKRLAENGCRVAVVDADLQHGDLARRLGVSAVRGWEHVIREDQPLEEVLIESVRDGVVLLPLANRADDDKPLLSDPRAGLSLATLRGQYDLVLVDTGPIVGRGLAEFVSLAEQSALDGALLLRDSRVPAKEGLADMKRLLAAARVPIVGLVDNFTPSDAGD